ncbi:hypothetical protein C8Q75DRAFT_804934 [Abortiporus biennis]|nr:hypothetical protein C8Q75DRAFT_804934 [Abortiporus biennis]
MIRKLYGQTPSWKAKAEDLCKPQRTNTCCLLEYFIFEYTSIYPIERSNPHTTSLPAATYGTLTKELPGEYPEEYFQRHELADLEREKWESSGDKEMRLRQLVKWEKSEKPPGKNGSVVFEWELAETEEVSYVHRRLVRSEVNEIPPNQPAHVPEDPFGDEDSIAHEIEADMAHHDDDPLVIEPIYKNF